MTINNIIKKLEKQGKRVYKAEFDFKECWFCNGTALIDLKDSKMIATTAKFKEIEQQIEQGKSHIYTIDGKIKNLTPNRKLGF